MGVHVSVPAFRREITRDYVKVHADITISSDQYSRYKDKIFCQLGYEGAPVNEYCRYISEVIDPYLHGFSTDIKTNRLTDHFIAVLGIYDKTGKLLWHKEVIADLHIDKLRDYLPKISGVDIRLNTRVSGSLVYFTGSINATISNVIGDFYNISPIYYIYIQTSTGKPTKQFVENCARNFTHSFGKDFWKRARLSNTVNIPIKVTRGKGLTKFYYIVTIAFTLADKLTTSYPTAKCERRYYYYKPFDKVYIKVYAVDSQTGKIVAESSLVSKEIQRIGNPLSVITLCKLDDSKVKKLSQKVKNLLPKAPPKPPVERLGVESIDVVIPEKIVTGKEFKVGITIKLNRRFMDTDRELGKYPKLGMYVNGELKRKYTVKPSVGEDTVHIDIPLKFVLPPGYYRIRWWAGGPDDRYPPGYSPAAYAAGVWSREFIVEVVEKPVKPPAKPPRKPPKEKPPITPPEAIAISDAYVEAPPSIGVNEKFTMHLVVDLNRDITGYEAGSIGMKFELYAYKPPAVIPLVSDEITLEKPGKTYTISIDAMFKSPGKYTISGTVSLVPLGDVNVSTKPVTIRSATIEVVEKPGKPPEEKPPEKPPKKPVDKKKIAAAIAIATIIGVAVAIGVRK